MRVIGFTGMPGSGKSEAMEVAKQRGYPVVRMGDLIWEEVERQGLQRDARNVGRVANDMRDKEGKDVWALRTVQRVRDAAAEAPIVLIDGVRNPEEVEVFRRELGSDFTLVAIEADQDERFTRMVKRTRADDSTDRQVLLERDERELGWGLAKTIQAADQTVLNHDTLETFRHEVANVLDELAR